MIVHVPLSMWIQAAPERVFATCTGPSFAHDFTGLWPIPALRSIQPHGPPGVGATRTVTDARGTRMTETILAWEPPSHHRYELTGFVAPMSWLVTRGVADWRFAKEDDGTRIVWTYDFELTRPLAVLAAWPLLRVMFQGAMKLALQSVKAVLEPVEH